MEQYYFPGCDPMLLEALAPYSFPDTLVGVVRYGQGHINDTYCVLCQPREGDCIQRFLICMAAL